MKRTLFLVFVNTGTCCAVNNTIRKYLFSVNGFYNVKYSDFFLILAVMKILHADL